uniref:Gag-Pol polyprotein n=1 Tax=Podarcis muralis TaxID=64176 RepID=A0A670J9F9_PODMU
MQIDGQSYDCLLDMGATYSTLTNSHLTPGDETRTVMGLDGIPRNCPLSKPAKVSVGLLSVKHTFLLTSSPVNLLGRDLLCKLNATIQCGQEGIYLHMPNESIFSFQGLLQEAHNTTIDLPPELLNSVSPSLWGTESTSVGLLRSAVPVKINYRKDLPFPCTKQYPLPPDAIDGLTPMIDEFLRMGVLVPCASPCNTPLLPMKKPNTNPVKWRLVQDLRLVNSFVIPRHAVVANPHHLLSTIPEGTVVYSVIDLCSAFFSIPVDPESQFLFAFTWQTGQLTWTRLPQGYVESPAIFSSILHQDLSDVTLPGGSALRLYVDDILLCGQDLESCKKDTIALLNILAQKGHKVSPKKIQYCKKEVKYLGHILGEGTRALTTDRIEAITKLPLPKTKRQLCGFIGMSGFCRAWIPRYGEFARPLTAMTHDNAPDQLQWSAEALEAFESIKRELRSSPALGLPDYRLPFSLFVHENKGVASGVLTQPFQRKNRPVAYYSLQLDTTVLGNVGCLRAVAAAALLLEKAQETVLGHDLTVNVPHAVATLLSLQGCQRFTIQRLNKYEAILLSPSNVTIKRVNSLNPATLLPLPDDGTPHHDCSQIVRHLEKPREDLDYLPLTNPDLVLYTDGSSKVVGGERKTGYAIVTDSETLEARPVHAKYSAQAAELIALIRACELGTGKRITIYTDSKYCFGLVHATGQIWLHRGFLTAAGTQIAHASLVQRLMNSIHLPEAISVVHCKAHTKGRDPVSTGNRRADSAAQEAALQPLSADNEFQGSQVLSDINFTEMYQTATPEEIKLWEEQGAHLENGIWYFPDKRLIMPKLWVPKHLRVLHQRTHWGREKLIDTMQRCWYAPGLTLAAKAAIKNCHTCQSFNPKHTARCPPGARPWAFVPFESLQIDFIDLPPCQAYKHALVIIDQLTGWVECFPTRRATAHIVAKILIQEIIPRFGVPRHIDSDRGSHFTSDIIQQIATALGIKWKLHTPYHPPSSGQVERMNQQLKSQLGKLCKESGIKWVNALPLVLHNLRACPRGNLKLSPYELLFGRPSPVYNTQFPTSELEVGESELTNYVIQLQKQLITLHRYAASGQNIPLDENVHPYQPGDWILAKTYHKVPLQPTWEGPYQVLLTTPTSVKVAEKTAWLHHTRCKPASAPEPASDDSPYCTPGRPTDKDTDTEDDQQTGPDRGTHRAQQTGPDRGTNRAQQTGPDQPHSSTHWTSEIIPATDQDDQPPIRLKLRKTHVV